MNGKCADWLECKPLNDEERSVTSNELMLNYSDENVCVPTEKYGKIIEMFWKLISNGKYTYI